ncbi:phosphatidylglycerol lysyltransferase domain-containing protein [Phaeobacter italicus]|uniref:phosphatidylglycerol lysyltransferase domain-containing protein n=1 Tax=Phaeobacter italicus TaxID=481446 RepID=UPI001CD5B779|nr:phosphatidylglycerol lysyltransferase domain-containing protein [Phaeobacter italicus]MCA0856404.1 phosphatidylglycerol lysyltransferase domain-containing protein [Phaeobacter italicus]
MPLTRLSRARHARWHVPQFIRILLPLVVTIACLDILQRTVALPDLAELGATLGALSLHQWLSALIATAISFWALGRYDSVAHRHLQTGLDGREARWAGMAAIALSQTIGFGLITGAFARWRLMPGLGPVTAARLTAMVSVSFMLALAAICATALVMVGDTTQMRLIGTLMLVVLATGLVLSAVFPVMRMGPVALGWPSLTAQLAFAGWALIDVTAAGTALWLLLPAGSEITLTALLPAYFIALGVALLSSAPGGAGAFELALCALLPTTAGADIIAAIVAFRLIYYALPACVAGATLLFPQAFSKEGSIDELGHDIRDAAHLPHHRTCAETQVIAQNGGRIHAFGLTQLAVLETTQASIALFGPISGRISETLDGLRHHARSRNSAACLYKCDAVCAQATRKAGWRVLRIASEAVLSPNRFQDQGPRLRQLRRKLRQAEKAGVVVLPASDTLPLEQMSHVDAAWRARHGRARGTTMGRFEPGYLQRQEVFLAWQDDEIIGFMSFHAAAEEWCLDLVRLRPDAPDGTGHALIRAALTDAAARAIPRLSLAAVPDHLLARHFDKGLRRFKESFAPTWEPRYAAAPNWTQMALALADLIRLVHWPEPIRTPPASTSQQQALSQEDLADMTWEAAAAYVANLPSSSVEQTTSQPPHNELEENAFALSRRA